MKSLIFGMIILAGLGFGFQLFKNGLVLTVPKIEVPAGRVYCQFVPRKPVSH